MFLYSLQDEEIRSAIVVFNATSGNPTGFFQLSQAMDDAKVTCGYFLHIGF